MLNWINRFNICCFLDNQQYQSPSGNIECIAGAGIVRSISCNATTAFRQLQEFQQSHADWTFGHLSYDLKNGIEELRSENPDRIGFPELYFFIPRVVLQLNENSLSIGVIGNDHEAIYIELINTTAETIEQTKNHEIHSRFSKVDYIDTVNRLKKHISLGDCYEINFCQEFYVEDISIDPVSVYQALSIKNPNPFAGFYKLEDRYCLCASPERFLQKQGSHLLSQPIKGTASRDYDPELDEQRKNDLRNSEKERAENVMVVDLVRNDLSRVCKEGTVKVSELFGIYSFPNVHQMISSIIGEQLPEYSSAEVIKACFPMGSMTGAPKKRVMELIEQYERTRRGLFSGSLGYFTPSGDFDFNVVIRSMLYNASTQYLSWQTGSAITGKSDAAQEYEECLLKGAAMREVLKFRTIVN